MNDVMVDLETMGTGSDAAIVAIGAVFFDPTTNALGPQFYNVVSLKSNVAFDRVIDPDTVLWWMMRSEKARAIFTQSQATAFSLNDALVNFANFLGGESVDIWGNGAAFDNVILRNAYLETNIPVPWNFCNDRCYRTIKALYPDIIRTRNGIHHHALDDAISQAEHLMTILNKDAK